jgi:anaerobic dimethyl sulfoxide reductase subunit B (iron-sulfur subunit)
MEHDLPHDQFGIKLSEVGPWEYAEGKWQYAYLPMPTEQCDLCATRREKGKLPTCVKHCQAKCLSFGTLAELVGQLESKPSQTLFHIKNA